MKSITQIILLSILIGLIGIVGLLGFGFYSMDIEDHYGDLQELYYSSNTGDVIINKTTSEFGIIEKSWKRINIITQKADSTDLYNWVNQNGIENETEIYRPENNDIDLTGISFSELIILIEGSKLKLISKN